MFINGTESGIFDESCYRFGSMSANPVLVETTRGEMVESYHRGAIAVVKSSGELVASWGDIDSLSYSRSSLKPFQTMATLETGAFDAFALGAEEIALHAASHNGEAGHVERVLHWLEKIGLQESDLQCGAQTPFWIMLNLERAHEAKKPRQVSNNCSGKHAGFLTATQHLGEDIGSYLSLAHPAQVRIRTLVAEMTGLDEERMVASTDLCRAPVYAVPLRNFAHGLARIAKPDNLGSRRAEAACRVMSAMCEHPWLVAGTDRPDTLLMQDEAFSGFAKSGAEGFYAMAFPGLDLGVAIKIDDGGRRASSVAAVSVLRKLGLLTQTDLDRLQSVVNPALKTWSGTRIGEVRPAAVLA